MYGYRNGSILGRIACITSYAEAEARYNKIKPIRGRSADIRPLSPDRRSPDSYRISKRVHPVLGTMYECVLYNTPVITFHFNGDVHINMGGWGTSNTRTFIQEILGVNCGRVKGSDFLRIKGEKVLISPSEPATIRKDAAGVWELVSTTAAIEVRLNKAKAKTVREKYKLFDTYLNGIIKLREREDEHVYYGKDTVIDLSRAEFDEALAERLRGMPSDMLTNKTSKKYRELCGLFFGLIRPDQPEDEQHNNFYKAFLLLSASVGGSYVLFNVNSRTSVMVIKAKEFQKHYKEVLYKWFSKDVFDEVQLPVGRLPNRKYRFWL